MKLATIFQYLEHLYDFQTIGYGGHFVFPNEAKISHSHVFIAINILCKFGEDIFINERDIEVYVKHDKRMHAHTEGVLYRIHLVFYCA